MKARVQSPSTAKKNSNNAKNNTFSKKKKKTLLLTFNLIHQFVFLVESKTTTPNEQSASVERIDPKRSACLK
jgi:hypothetical protein